MSTLRCLAALVAVAVVLVGCAPGVRRRVAVFTVTAGRGDIGAGLRVGRAVER